MSYADNPASCRARAERARADAEQMSDPLLRRKVHAIADNYEKMALRAEVLLAQERPNLSDN
jgi:hypothetical protein